MYFLYIHPPKHYHSYKKDFSKPTYETSIARYIPEIGKEKFRIFSENQVALYLLSFLELIRDRTL